jgi:RecA-family ATPase
MGKPYIQPYYAFHQEFYDSTPSWLIDGWLTKQNFTIVAGQPQSYKTYLVLDMAWALCTGNDFLGQFPVRQTGNVLVCQMEDSNKNFAKRLWAIDNRYYGMYPTEVTDEYIIFNRNTLYCPLIPREYRFSFENQASLLYLEEMIKRVNPVMVIIDPLRSASEDVDKFFAKVGKQIDDQLRPLRDKYNVGFTVVHHATKNGGSGQQKIFGSNIMIGAFESKLLLERVNQNDPSDSRVKVDRYFKEEGNQLPIQLTFKINYQNADVNEQYSVAVDEMSEEERKIDIISKYLIVNGPQKIGTLFDEYGEQFGYARATSLNYFMEKHEDKFVKNGTKWSVTPDKGD